MRTKDLKFKITNKTALAKIKKKINHGHTLFDFTFFEVRSTFDDVGIHS